MSATEQMGIDERYQIARLFRFLSQGESLAHDCARAQAMLAPDHKARRFLNSQARQEAFHKALFDRVASWLAPSRTDRQAALAPMQAYRRRLESSLTRGDFAASLLAQQVILEGLGDVVCERIALGIANRGLGFARMRRLIVHQEHAHRLFGVRRLETLLIAQPELIEKLVPEASAYFELVEAMLHSLEDLFEFFDEHAEAYVNDVRTGLPEWLQKRL